MYCPQTTYLPTLNNVAMSLFFYIIDRLEQAKSRTAYKLKKYRERLANLLDQGKEHCREYQLQRERLEKSQKVMLSLCTMQQEEDLSQSSQWAKVSNIYKEFSSPPPPSNPTIFFFIGHTPCTHNYVSDWLNTCTHNPRI